MFAIEGLIKILLTDSDEKYGLDYQYAPLEKSLSRYKRGLISSPLTNIMTTLFGKSVGVLCQPVLDIYNTLIGKNECPKGEKITVDLFTRVFKPLQTINVIKTVLCNMLDMVGSAGRAAISKGVQMAVQFTKFTLIPLLHKILIKLRDTGLLPPSIVVMINTFDAAYKVLKFMGYVG